MLVIVSGDLYNLLNKDGRLLLQKSDQHWRDEPRESSGKWTDGAGGGSQSNDSSMMGAAEKMWIGIYGEKIKPETAIIENPSEIDTKTLFYDEFFRNNNYGKQEPIPIFDMYGNRIIASDNSFKHTFFGKDDEGKIYFHKDRAERLNWIKNTLQTSRNVYQDAQTGKLGEERRVYFKTYVFPNKTHEHFQVVVEKAEGYFIITAYPTTWKKIRAIKNNGHKIG